LTGSAAFLPLIAVFSLLGGFTAYLITLQEYRKHFPAGIEAHRRALLTGLLAVIVLFLLSSAALYLFSNSFE
jgi:hypothetical protein